MPKDSSIDTNFALLLPNKIIFIQFISHVLLNLKKKLFPKLHIYHECAMCYFLVSLKVCSQISNFILHGYFSVTIPLYSPRKTLFSLILSLQWIILFSGHFISNLAIVLLVGAHQLKDFFIQSFLNFL